MNRTIPLDENRTATNEPNPEQEVIRIEELRKMERMIGDLSVRLKEVVNHIVEGKTYSEISQVLGISEAAVRKRMERARNQLATFYIASVKGGYQVRDDTDLQYDPPHKYFMDALNQKEDFENGKM